MFGGEINVVGTNAGVPFNERFDLYNDMVDIHFYSEGNNLIVIIDTRQAATLVRELTNYLHKRATAEVIKSIGYRRNEEE
jgi:hypothetical protein